MKKKLKENKKKFKENNRFRLILRTAFFLGLYFLFMYITVLIGRKNPPGRFKYLPGTPEYEAAVALELQKDPKAELLCAADNNVIFGLTNEEDGADRFVVLIENENGEYIPGIDDLLVPADDKPDFLGDCAAGFAAGKFIAAVPVYYNKSESGDKINSDKINVYDSENNQYPALRGDNLSLYYCVRDAPLPENYKIFVEYGGKIYNPIDMGNEKISAAGY